MKVKSRKTHVRIQRNIFTNDHAIYFFCISKQLPRRVLFELRWICDNLFSAYAFNRKGSYNIFNMPHIQQIIPFGWSQKLQPFCFVTGASVYCAHASCCRQIEKVCFTATYTNSMKVHRHTVKFKLLWKPIMFGTEEWRPRTLNNNYIFLHKSVTCCCCEFGAEFESAFENFCWVMSAPRSFWSNCVSFSLRSVGRWKLCRWNSQWICYKVVKGNSMRKLYTSAKLLGLMISRWVWLVTTDGLFGGGWS